MVRIATADSVRGLHMAVRRKHALPTGKYAYHHRSEAMSRWQRITRGLLDDWDWANCLATGDAVLRALVADDEVDAGFGQMDLFFFGLSPQQCVELQDDGKGCASLRWCDEGGGIRPHRPNAGAGREWGRVVE